MKQIIVNSKNKLIEILTTYDEELSVSTDQFNNKDYFIGKIDTTKITFIDLIKEIIPFNYMMIF